MDVTISAGIFVGAYILIVTDRFHKTVVALAGASLLLALNVVSQSDSFFSRETGIDYDVIFLLVSMMIIINITRKTGLFQWIAHKCIIMAKGHPMRIMLLLSLATAGTSALLDNVTTVLLMAPVTIVMAQELEVDPVPFLITEVLASNIGGAATLIGDPPNIMIASKASLTFVEFIINLTPVSLLVLAAHLLSVRLIFRKRLQVSSQKREELMQRGGQKVISDRPLLIKCLIVIGLTLAGFMLHGVLGLEPATVALAGAALLFLLAGEHPHDILRDVEWPTIFFFIGLFIMVGALIKTGLINSLSGSLLSLTQGNLPAASFFILWFSAFASAVVDNIPFVATMNPLVVDMAHNLWPNLEGADLLRQEGLMPVWWALALGSCLGGNGTLIGASANVVVAGISEKHGFPISFLRFTAYGLPLMVQSMLICTVYIWVRYFLI